MTESTAAARTSIEEILENLSLLEDWEDRYRYIIELGHTLEKLPQAAYSEANKVRGCASQVWLASTTSPGSGGKGPTLSFQADSDAHIVRGLIAILFALYQDRTPAEILKTDAHALFDELGLGENLTQQRSNGFFSMVQRIRSDAEALQSA
jgi:cysteine desulfuration protein SufE